MTDRCPTKMTHAARMSATLARDLKAPWRRRARGLLLPGARAPRAEEEEQQEDRQGHPLC